MVMRPLRVKVRYQDIDGKTRESMYYGFNAVVVQHEIDHLHGVLFVDKLVEDCD